MITYVPILIGLDGSMGNLLGLLGVLIFLLVSIKAGWVDDFMSWMDKRW